LRITPVLTGFARLAAAGLIAATASVCTSQALGEQPSLVAANAWVRAIPGSDTAAAYLTLRNVTARAVTVTGVESSAAAHAMIHESTTEGGQSRMRPREPLTIAPQSTVSFAPGGLHIMLHDLKKPLSVGDRVPLTFRLTGGSVLQVQAAVRPLSAE
jgi:periplasmic copper chaperone A